MHLFLKTSLQPSPFSLGTKWIARRWTLLVIFGVDYHIVRLEFFSSFFGVKFYILWNTITNEGQSQRGTSGFWHFFIFSDFVEFFGILGFWNFFDLWFFKLFVFFLFFRIWGFFELGDISEYFWDFFRLFGIFCNFLRLFGILGLFGIIWDFEIFGIFNGLFRIQIRKMRWFPLG